MRTTKGNAQRSGPAPVKEAPKIYEHLDSRGWTGSWTWRNWNWNRVPPALKVAVYEKFKQGWSKSRLKAIVKDHLEPLPKATKNGMYGVEIAGATRLGALRLIDKWKGISASTKARLEAKIEDARSKGQSAAHTVCVVVANDKEAAELARLLAPGGAPGVVIDVDAKVD